MDERDIKRCDLHTHSYYSDGSFSPAEIIRMSKEAGLSAVALTDHNTTKGLKEFMSCELCLTGNHPADRSDMDNAGMGNAGMNNAGMDNADKVKRGLDNAIELAAGCEFTTEFEKKEVHIVGLFLPENTWEDVEKFIAPMKKSKHDSNLTLIGKLCEGGFDITYDEIMAITDADEFNRAHVARVLYKKGYVSSVKDAFEKYLYEGSEYYYPPERLDVFRTIAFIRDCKAVPVLAHPFLNLNEEELRRMIPAAKEHGLAAMETRYSKFDEKTTKKAAEMALEYGLLQSGGSDFHGDAKPGISPGTGKGDLEVPYDFYLQLKKRVNAQ